MIVGRIFKNIPICSVVLVEPTGKDSFGITVSDLTAPVLFPNRAQLVAWHFQSYSKLILKQYSNQIFSEIIFSRVIRSIDILY